MSEKFLNQRQCDGTAEPEPESKKELTGGCHARFVRFILYLVNGFQRGDHRVISVGGPGNGLPHGFPCVPKVGWPPVECLMDDPSRLGPNPSLVTQQVGEPSPERGITDPFKNLSLKQDGPLCGVAEVSAERGGHQTPVEVGNGRVITASKDLGSRHGLLAVCRNALNRLKRNRGIEDVAEVVYQKLVRKNLEDVSRTARENQELPVTNHRLLSGQSERQGREDCMLVAAPSGVRTTQLKDASLVCDEASQHVDGGSLVHVSISSERSSGGTAEVDSETTQGDNGGCSLTPCCASSSLEEVVPILDTLFRRNGVGKVCMEGGKLRFRFAHCVIGVVVSGDVPRLTSWVEKAGLLSEIPKISNFNIGDTVEANREGVPLPLPPNN